MSIRNLTISLPDDLVRRAKVLAAERDTSVSAIVRDLLVREVGAPGDYDAMWEREEQLMDEGILSVGEITWDRDELHTR